VTVRTVWCEPCQRRHVIQAYIPNTSPVYDDEPWPWYVMLPVALVASVFVWMVAALAIVAWA
jgi:hypothetical protein